MMSFIVAGCALLLALIVSTWLDGRSALGERDAMSNPFGRGDVERDTDSQYYGTECLPDGH